MKRKFFPTGSSSCRVYTENVTSISAVKDRIKTSYIPYYAEKLHLCQKKILPPSEDRLAELTIEQIDRLVHLEKIRMHLKTKKNQSESVHMDERKSEGKHLNIFGSGFIARLNKIAVKRSIRHVRAAEFDDYEITTHDEKKKK